MAATTTSVGRLTSATEAAREYGIKYTTLRDLVFRGQIPVVRLGRAWYFDRRDLDRFIAAAKTTEDGGVRG
jgi:excisionase family DNA binding protein